MNAISKAWETFLILCALAALLLAGLAFPHGMLLALFLLAALVVFGGGGLLLIVIAEEGKHCDPRALDRITERTPMVDESKAAYFERPGMRVVE